ncbi:MAG: hypothetical protein FWG20_06755, partial [Candidatus Cloacimonetes bacterium]|nr:hypothetical protein [Candidatus Cloacimonadota bacterium]
MKKLFIIPILLVSSIFLFAFDDTEYTGFKNQYGTSIQKIINGCVVESANTNNQRVDYSYELDMTRLPDFIDILAEESLPALLKTFAIPSAKATLDIHKMTIGIYNREGEYLKSESKTESDLIYIKQDFYFKEMRGYSVFIDLFVDGLETISIITSASFSINGIGEIEMPSSISEAFEPSYRNLAANYDSSYLSELQYKKPSMMILSHNVLNPPEDDLLAYINWKKSIGFDIEIVYKGTATSTEQI